MKTPGLRWVAWGVLAGLALSAWAVAEGLDGKKLTVVGGDQASVNVPVALAYDGPAPEGKTVQVVDTKSGKVFPATVGDKELVFVVDALAPKEKLECQVKVSKEAAAPKVVLKKNGDAPEVEVAINGVPFTTYHYSNDNRKPFLWPVLGEGGVHVTRDWPMDENAPELAAGKKDHIHHKSIWTAYGDINGVDCWGEEGDKAGYQHSDDVTFGSGDAYGWIKAKDTWQDPNHKPILAEDREYQFYEGPAGARLIDVTVAFTASYGTAKFNDTKEGGIVAFRIRPEIEATKKGVITNASGATGEAGCWGKPSPWCDYAGPIEGAGVRGIAVFDNASNLRFPTCWHVRGYGLNGASVFGLAAFTNKKENGDYTLDEGKSLTFHYRILIHSGDVQEAKIADRYADYATPPKAEWVK